MPDSPARRSCIQGTPTDTRRASSARALSPRRTIAEHQVRSIILRCTILMLSLLCTRAFAQGPNGGCCLPNGNCVFASQTDCANAGGVWGMGNPCGGPCLGACCTLQGGCTVSNAATCAAGGGLFRVSMPCEPGDICSGACCLGDGSCLFRQRSQCDAFGGHFQSGTTCEAARCFDPVGACCADFGNVFAPECMVLSEQDCWSQYSEAGYLWFGPGTTCTPFPCEQPGGCCVGTVCSFVSPLACASMQGQFRGVGTTCTSDPCARGACCNSAFGPCVRVSATTCTSNGGVWRGYGSDCEACAPMGACCVPAIEGPTCFDVSQGNCQDRGGYWAGPGTTCSVSGCPTVGSCCRPDGSCQISNLPLCQATNGGVFLTGHLCEPGLCTPINDWCEGAVALACGTTVIADNTAAGIAPADPQLPCGLPGQNPAGSLWFKFVASGGEAAITTCATPGSGSASLAMFSADGHESTPCVSGYLTLLTCDSGSCSGLPVLSAQGLVPGRTYYILLVSHGLANLRAFTVTLSCPPLPSNDDCTSAAVLLYGNNTGTTAGATVEPDLPTLCAAGAQAAPDVWFLYNPTCTGMAVFEIMNAAYDTILSAHSCPTLSLLGCDDDGGSSVQGAARLVLPVSTGQPVHIRVSGKAGGKTGEFLLNAACYPSGPSVPPGTILGSGLAVDYFEGVLPESVPDFGIRVPYLTTTVANIHQPATSGTFMNSQRSADFAALFRGVITVPATAQYQFSLEADDGSLLEIDGVRVVNNDGLHAAEVRYGVAHLTAGPHLIRVGYFQHSELSTLILRISGGGLPDQIVPESMLSRVALPTNDDCAHAELVVGNSVGFDNTLAHDDGHDDVCSIWNDLYYRLQVPDPSQVTLGFPSLSGGPAVVEILRTSACSSLTTNNRVLCQVVSQGDTIDFAAFANEGELLIRLGSSQPGGTVSGQMSAQVGPLLSSAACCLGPVCFLTSVATCQQVAGTVQPTSTCFSICCTAPHFVPPQPVTGCIGAPAVLSVPLQTSGSLTYQWHAFGIGNPLEDSPGGFSGSQTPSLTIPDVSVADSGSYWLEIFGPCSYNVVSVGLHVVSYQPNLDIYRSPPTVCPGGFANLYVPDWDAGSTYQWSRNGVPLQDQPGHIEGTTSSYLILANVTAADLGDYQCVATSPCGNRTGSAPLYFGPFLTFTSQPQSKTVCQGALAVFTAGIAAPPNTPVSYQWRKNGVDVSSATYASYAISAVSSADQGTYDVQVSSGCGALTSTPAVLTVTPLPAITQQPLSVTVCEGAEVSFSVQATGTNLTYQWRRGLTPLPGATTPTLTIPAAVPADGGLSYSCVVSNSCGSVASSGASLIVSGVYQVTTQPQSQTVCASSLTSVTLTFGVTGGGPGRTYQWRKDGTAIPGATNSIYAITAFNDSFSGIYDCVVASTCGVVVSSPATLIVNTPIAPGSISPGATICSGEPFTFSVSSSGTVATYQWRRNGVDIPGAIGSTYTLSAATVADTGLYSCFLSGPCTPAGVTSGSAQLTVRAPTVVTLHPTSQTVCAGANVSMLASGTGQGTVTYQWRKNGQPISGATSGSYSLPAIQTSSAGAYDCILTAACGSTATNVAVLAVNAQTAVISQPQNQRICVGSTATFSVSATGSGVTYQWFRQSHGVLPGQTSPILTIPNITAADFGSYWCVVTGACGSVTSNSAILQLGLVPTYAFILGSQEISPCTGSPVTLTSATDASAPLNYQWRRNGQDLPDETGPTLTIDPITAVAAGMYTVMISNSCGSMESLPTTVTPISAPTISTQPISRSVCGGSSTSFSVVATDVVPGFGYQWQLNGVNLFPGSHFNGTTTPILSVINPGSAQAGQYRCVVTNACGTLTSAEAMLAVFASGTIITTQPQSTAGCVGANVVLSVVADGPAPLTYQWRMDGRPMGPTATNPSLLVPITSTGISSAIDVVVTSACGPTTSNTVTVSGFLPPAFTLHPQDTNACGGGSILLTTTASDATTHQWRKAGVPIPDATASSLTIAPARATDVGVYDCVATNPCSSVTSNAALIMVCLPDVNCSGALTVQDIFDFLTMYFAGNPAADINASDTVTVQDLFDFLGAYFAGCP